MNRFISTFLLILISLSGFSYTGEIIESFDTPGSYPTGLTFDGKNLWIADYKTDLLYCIDPDNGEVIKSISSLVKLCGMRM